jgi:hypothetical protein
MFIIYAAALARNAARFRDGPLSIVPAENYSLSFDNMIVQLQLLPRSEF